MRRLPCLFVAAIGAVLTLTPAPADDKLPEGFVPLFNGKDLGGWKIPKGDNDHWKVVNGVIDYDAKSESSEKEKSLFTEKSFGDFVLRADWRLKPEPGCKHEVPVILPSGETKVEDGKPVMVEIEDLDSGIYLRGSSKAQVNIWMWPIGSGEVYGYRTSKDSSAEVKAAVTPKKKADKPRGEWNTFEITMKGDRLTVKLNDEEVIHEAQLPGVPKEGPIALQHHGSWDAEAKKWKVAPSLVQFRNIAIKELK